MKKMRKVLALMLALIMVLGTMNLSAYAAEDNTYEEQDTYVLNFSTDEDIEGYSNFDKPRFYFSPYRTDIWVTTNEETGKKTNLLIKSKYFFQKFFF